MKDPQLFPKQCINLQTTERHLFISEIVKITLNIFNNGWRFDILWIETINNGNYLAHYKRAIISKTSQRTNL